MAKILGSWSGMRKTLEEEMLYEPLRGKVRYNCTAYVGMDGCRIFEVFFRGKLFKQFSWETVNSWFVREGLARKTSPMSIAEYWTGFQELLGKYPMNARSEYTDGEFADALEKYRNSDIKASLLSDDPIVKMFALLDRRAGKRTLDAMGDVIAQGPEWLKQVYKFRMNPGQG